MLLYSSSSRFLRENQLYISQGTHTPSVYLFSVCLFIQLPIISLCITESFPNGIILLLSIPSFDIIDEILDTYCLFITLLKLSWMDSFSESIRTKLLHTPLSNSPLLFFSYYLSRSFTFPLNFIISFLNSIY